MPVTPAPSFQPSPEQQHFFNFVAENPGFSSITHICKFSGVSRSQYYRWSQDSGFRQWFAQAWASTIIFDGAMLLNKARGSNDFKFWKALFDLTFDPKGLALLAHWQQAVSNLPQSPVAPVPGTTQENKAVTQDSETKTEKPVPVTMTPVQAAPTLEKGAKIIRENPFPRAAGSA